MAAPDAASHLLYIYVTDDGPSASAAAVPEASPLAELAKSAEVTHDAYMRELTARR